MQQVSQATLTPYTVYVWNENMVKFVGVGCRLAIIRWKTTTDKVTETKVAPKSAMCVSLPLLEFEIEPTELKVSVKDYLETQQDMIIRKIIDNHFDAHENVVVKEIVILPSWVDYSGLAKFHTINTTNGKLSSEQIKSWFEENVSFHLEERLAQITGITDVVLKKSIEQHKMLLMKLSSPKAMVSEKIANQLLKVVSLDTSDFSGVKDALMVKLLNFQSSEEELLAAL